MPPQVTVELAFVTTLLDRQQAGAGDDITDDKRERLRVLTSWLKANPEYQDAVATYQAAALNAAATSIDAGRSAFAGHVPSTIGRAEQQYSPSLLARRQAAT